MLAPTSTNRSLACWDSLVRKSREWVCSQDFPEYSMKLIVSPTAYTSCVFGKPESWARKANSVDQDGFARWLIKALDQRAGLKLGIKAIDVDRGNIGEA
jgi:hypothetical protein